MISNRALAIILLLILIPIGFLLIFRPSPLFPQPLRRDEVPAGAYVVPWMTPTQSPASLWGTPPELQPWNLTSIMQGALRFDITFIIALPNETRTVSSTIFLSHDLNLLYVGSILRGMYHNPTSHWNPDGISFNEVAQYLKILFDVDSDGVLRAPETGSGPFALVPCPFEPSQCGLGADGWGSAHLVPGYVDLSWVNYVTTYRHGFWDLAFNVCEQPSSIAGVAAEYNHITGDLVLFFARRLSHQPNSCANALQMRAGERWVMGFLFEIGYQNEAALQSDYADGWPIKTFPYTTNDASSWPKLVINLTT